MRLHRCWLPREHPHAIPGCMAGKIDEHVNAGGRDDCGKFAVGHRMAVDEAIDSRLYGLAIAAVVAATVRKCINLELRAVVQREYVRQHVTDRVVAQVARQIAYAQTRLSDG